MADSNAATTLVTGGAGFIGSHLVDRLLSEGRRVRVLDNFSTGRVDNLAGARNAGDRFEVIEGDLRSDDVVARALAGASVVFHLAALGSVERSVNDPVTTHDVNATGTLRLLTAARDAGVGRFLFAGSSSVYGDVADLPKTEAMPTRPISPYAMSKLNGEMYGRIFSRIYGMETVTLRYFNVFGPRQNPKSQYAAVIPIFIDRLLNGEPPEIDGDGEQSRDFTFVDNVVEANLLASTAPADSVAGRIFNIACGARYTLNHLVAMLHEYTGKSTPPRHRDPRPGDVRHSQADISLAGECFSYRPVVTFEEGLRRTVESFTGVSK